MNKKVDETGEAVVGCGIGLMVFVIVIVLAAIPGLLITWVAVASARGFGYELPFWPVFGILFVLFAIFGGRKVSSGD